MSYVTVRKSCKFKEIAATELYQMFEARFSLPPLFFDGILVYEPPLRLVDPLLSVLLFQESLPLPLGVRVDPCEDISALPVSVGALPLLDAALPLAVMTETKLL